MSNHPSLIAISGSPGSGKTTYAKHVAKLMGYEFVSAGSIFRSIASEMGVSVVELNKMAAQNPSIDRMIERKIREKASKGNIVVEGHLVAWTLYDIADILIYLKAPLGVRLRRIAKREGKDLKTVAKETLEREYYEAMRYKKLYGVDVSDLSIFDIIIDTSLSDESSIKKTLESIIRGLF